MVAIRKTTAKANQEFGPDPSLDLPLGAHLKVKSAKLFEPKFHAETGDLWSSAVSLKLEVVDDRTAEGDADGLEFFDRFELKMDEDLGYDDEALKRGNIRDFSADEREELLDQDNWTVRTGTKLDNLLKVLYGEAWINGEMAFDPDDLVGKEFIAKVHPRTGKRPGSYTGWETFMSLEPPKKKRRATKVENAKDKLKKTEDEVERDLTEAEEREMNEALG
jgi:hypothetical protein